MENKKIKNFFMCLLCFVFESFCVSAVAAVNVENARAEGAATTENIKEYTVGAVSVHHLSTNGKVYAMFVDEEGNDCDLGYNSWVPVDEYTEKFEEYLTINGKKMSEI